MSSSHVVPLRAADGNFVEAVLHERIGAGYALQVDDEWQAHFAAEEARAVAEFTAPVSRLSFNAPCCVRPCHPMGV